MQVSYDEDLFERPLEIRDQSVYKTILGGSSNSVYLQPDELNLFKDLDLPVDNEKGCMYENSSEAVVGQQGSITESQSLYTSFNEIEPVPIADLDLYSEVECTVVGNEDMVETAVETNEFYFQGECRENSEGKNKENMESENAKESLSDMERESRSVLKEVKLKGRKRVRNESNWERSKKKKKKKGTRGSLILA